MQNFLSSGMTGTEAEQVWLIPERWQLFEYLSRLSEPLRIPDLLDQARSMGIAEFRPPLPVGPAVPFLASPVFHRGQRVGVAVFNAQTGAPESLNREAMRIVESLSGPEQSPEALLEVVTFARADGRELSLREFPMAELLSTGGTVRAEEIVLRVPDGRSISVLINATPIHSEDGRLASFVVTLQDMTPLEEIEKLRAEFLAMVSHELRTPLAADAVEGLHVDGVGCADGRLRFVSNSGRT